MTGSRDRIKVAGEHFHRFAADHAFVRLALLVITVQFVGQFVGEAPALGG